MGLHFMACVCIFARDKNLLDRGSKPCRDDRRDGTGTVPYKTAMTTKTKGKNNV